jgi:hypothetical protein
MGLVGHAAGHGSRAGFWTDKGTFAGPQLPAPARPRAVNSAG